MGKLFLEEPESFALRRFLGARPRVTSSALVRVEVLRALRRAGAEQGVLDEARSFLLGIHLRAPSDDILDQASSLGSAALRSLDAVHLATALDFRPSPGAFLCYDERLAAAARLHGLRVVAPGLDEVHEP